MSFELLKLFPLEFAWRFQSHYLLSRLSQHTKVFSRIALVKLSNFYVAVSEIHCHFSVRDLRNFIFSHFLFHKITLLQTLHSSNFNINIQAHSFLRLKIHPTPESFCITKANHMYLQLFLNISKSSGYQSDPMKKC